MNGKRPTGASVSLCSSKPVILPSWSGGKARLPKTGTGTVRGGPGRRLLGRAVQTVGAGGGSVAERGGKLEAPAADLVPGGVGGNPAAPAGGRGPPPVAGPALDGGADPFERLDLLRLEVP